MERKKERNLKKSLRESRRYLLLEISNKKNIKENVEKAVLDYVGVLGYSKSSLVWIKDDILAVNRKEVDKIKAGLIISGIKVKKISGSLKGLK